MKKFTVNTGYGYFVDKQGHKTLKAELPVGEHDLKDDFTYVEVWDKAALDLIQLYIDPIQADIDKNESEINKRVRDNAIAELINEGKIPPNYK